MITYLVNALISANPFSVTVTSCATLGNSHSIFAETCTIEELLAAIIGGPQPIETADALLEHFSCWLW